MIPGGRTVLSIGSNLGDRLEFLRSVVDAVADGLLAVSSVYETPPWGGVVQEPFLNAVLVVARRERDAWGWLRAGHELEQAAGRIRAQRFGPRTLDVDVISYGARAVELAEPDLVLPHPRAHQRAFVLVPWLEVEPDAVLAGHGAVARCLSGLDVRDVAGVRRRDDLPLAR